MNKKCRYCEDKDLELLSQFPDIYISGSTLQIEYDAYSVGSSFYDEMSINYCPMCGRKLKEEKNEKDSMD